MKQTKKRNKKQNIHEDDKKNNKRQQNNSLAVFWKESYLDGVVGKENDHKNGGIFLLKSFTARYYCD